MTQETTHMPLDERGLQVARDTVKTKSAYNQLADISTVADIAIRAYLQTAAADVRGLVERLERKHQGWLLQCDEWETRAKELSPNEDWSETFKKIRITIYAEAASTLQTLSASNAALEAENERLRGALKQTEYLMTKDSFSAAERLSEGLARVRQARAALTAAQGGAHE